MKHIKKILPVLLILFIVALVVTAPFLIKINDISCQSQYGPCSPDVSQKLDSFKGKSLAAAKKGISGELKSDSTILNFAFQLKFPSTLKVDLIENKAYYALVGKDLTNYFLVDKEGYVIKILPGTNLPRVIVDNPPPNVGEKVGDKEIFSLKIISDLWNLYQIKEGIMTVDGMTVILSQGIKVIFPLEGDKDVLMGSLQLILSRLNGEAKDFKINVSIIDLRFKNPVLK